MRSTRLARERRHTLYFLRHIRRFSPVFLDTEVDMTRVVEHRAAARADGRRYSVVTYVLHAVGRVLAAHPEANSVIGGGIVPKVLTPDSVDGKLTLDRRVNGHRVVLSTVLTGLQEAGIDAVQDRVDHVRDGDPHTMPEFAGVRALVRLPARVGATAFRLALATPRRRRALMGTVALTSLGHGVVDSFHSVGGTTVTLGVGRITDRPVVRDGQVCVAPVMRLSLCFDHRVIDGAEAADVLADLRGHLETFADQHAAAPAVAR